MVKKDKSGINHIGVVVRSTPELLNEIKELAKKTMRSTSKMILLIVSLGLKTYKERGE